MQPWQLCVRSKLGEQPGAVAWLAIATAVAGVALARGALPALWRLRTNWPA